jgi:uncharacterized Fe-S cluster-containing radical SAM superfamily protein
VTGACAAPSAAWYFRPDGWVMACCASWHPLGRVTGPERQSLREIWDGHATRVLRDALDEHDYTVGCWECGLAAGHDRREQSLAATFDRWSPTDSPAHPALMDFALSNRCNLECVMCNGGLSSAIRARREGRPPLPPAYDDRFFAELWEFLPHLRRAQFKGGEPFLSLEHRRVWDRLLETGHRPEISVTTNGTLWNESVERYLRELRMEVVVSVDAIDPARLEQIRVGIDPEQFWRNVDRIQAVTDETGRALTLSFCLMADNWQELGPFLAETDRRGVVPDVIWVDGPARFNLLTAGREVLEAARQGLGRAAGPHGSAARRIWEDAVARLEDAGPAVPVTVGSGARRRGLDVFRSELSAAGEPQLLELEYRDAVIRQVRVPEWAEDLAPRDWIGWGLDETMTLLATRVPGTMRSSIEPLDGGVHRAEFLFADVSPALRLRGVYVPDPVDSSTSHLLLTLVDAA